jgi:mono/diheme cytochrome c family protein
MVNGVMRPWFAVLLPVLLCLAPLTAQAAIDGPALFDEHCAKCHGSDGQARTLRGYLYFAQNLASPSWQAAKSDANILKKINTGPGFMPAFEKSLTLEERESLVRVVRGFASRSE